MTYDAHGIVSFTVDPASLHSGGYALSGTVPEPATLGLLALTSLALLTRSRRRPRVPEGQRGRESLSDTHPSPGLSARASNAAGPTAIPAGRPARMWPSLLA